MTWVSLFQTGAAYSRAETALREFVEISGLPFLPTPMGKGVLPDDHPKCVAAARSRSDSLLVYKCEGIQKCKVQLC